MCASKSNGAASNVPTENIGCARENSTLPRKHRGAGKNARQRDHAQQITVEKPPRIAGSTPQPFQVTTLHPIGCTHLRPRDEIQSSADTYKRYARHEALGVIGKQLL